MKIDNNTLVAISLCALFLMVSGSICGMVTKKRHRRYKVRPMNRCREDQGFYETLIHDMLHKELDYEMFFKYTRMTPDLFYYLVELVQPLILKDKTKKPISTEVRVLITLHFLAEGCSMQELAWGYRIGKATVHVIIKEVCLAIWTVLSEKFVVTPVTPKEWQNVAEGFEKRWNLPNCVGALDGKHVNIIAPAKSGTIYFNYKKIFSLVVMATCDAFYRFLSVDVGSAGSNHDSAVFRDSNFGKALFSKELGIPISKKLPNTNQYLNYYFAADSAFPLGLNIIRPFPGSNLGYEKNIFNYRLSRGRRTIENTFGIWSQRWRILRRSIYASIEMCESITLATIGLHNFLQNADADLPPEKKTYCPPGFTDSEENGVLRLGSWRNDPVQLESIKRQGSNNATTLAKEQIDALLHYFISPAGKVPWQENYVLRGSLPQYGFM